MAEQNIAIKTVFQMHDTNKNGRITREDFLLYGERTRKRIIEYGLSKVEASFSYYGIMVIADALGLVKPENEGGKSLNIDEFEKVRRQAAASGVLPFANRVYHTALFRAIDANCNGYVESREWITYLKIRETYVDDNQAMKSFNSIDKNKDGKLSMEEFVEYSIDFWCNLGENHNAKNLYGTE